MGLETGLTAHDGKSYGRASQKAVCFLKIFYGRNVLQAEKYQKSRIGRQLPYSRKLSLLHFTCSTLQSAESYRDKLGTDANSSFISFEK